MAGPTHHITPLLTLPLLGSAAASLALLSPRRRRRRRRSADPGDSPEEKEGRFVEETTMAGSFQLNPDASPFVPASLSLFADKTPEKQAESSSKGDHSGSILDPSQYEETDMDPLALANSVFLMFPNVSTDFIDELLKANDFDINLTIDMIQELYSRDKLHDDAELGFSTFSDGSDLRDGHGIPCGDNHRAESSSNNQALQNEKPATSDAKPVPATFPKTNSPHKDLGLPDDNKSMGTSAVN